MKLNDTLTTLDIGGGDDPDAEALEAIHEQLRRNRQAPRPPKPRPKSQSVESLPPTAGSRASLAAHRRLEKSVLRASHDR